MRGPEETVEEGIYRSLKTGRYRIKVSVVINGKRRYAPCPTFHKDTPISVLRAKKHELLKELNEKIEAEGGRAENGVLSGDVQIYWRRAKLSKARRQQMERHYIPFWVRKFGKRSRDWMIKNVPLLIEALDTITNQKTGLPVSAATKDHYVGALSHVFTTVYGENAPNPCRDIPALAETDPAKLPRRDQDYFLIDRIFEQMHETWRGEPCKAKAWLRCQAYGGVTLAQLSKMGRDSFLPRERQVIPFRRLKGKAKNGSTGAPTVIRGLSDDGYEAFLNFDRLDFWGTERPCKTTVYDTFRLALQKALAYLKAHPELVPDGVRIDWKRAAKMRPYDLRHSYGSKVLKDTRDLDVARLFLGQAYGSKQIYRYVQGAITDRVEAASDIVSKSFRERPKLKLAIAPTIIRRPRKAA